MNGDFVDSNDLAYIYDPNDPNTPQYLKDGINNILSNPDVEESTKDYIRKSFGKVAERNGGVNGFYGTLDLRLAKKFQLYKKHSLELSVDIFNVLNMLNKDWGAGHNLELRRFIPSRASIRRKKSMYTMSMQIPVCLV